MLDGVIGNKVAKSYMTGALISNRLPSSYIISGEAGTGQEIFAMQSAYALMCEDKDNKPCMKCKVCRSLIKGLHPDFFLLDYKDQNSIGVDDIRSKVTDTVGIIPLISDRKVYVILEADKMTVQAQNSLLKTIEEPPDYAFFFLVTSNASKLLPTIHSRCIKLDTAAIDVPALSDMLLNKYKYDKKLADRIANFSLGRIDKAVMLSENAEMLGLYEEAFKLIDIIKKEDYYNILAGFEALETAGVSMSDCLDLMKLWFRDVCVFKATNNDRNLIFKENKSKIAKEANALKIEGLNRILFEIDNSKDRLRNRIGKDAVVELLRQVICQAYTT